VLVNSSFKEGLKRSVEWDDVDEQAFISLWHFAYTSRYTAPPKPVRPIIVPSTERREIKTKNKRKNKQNYWDAELLEAIANPEPEPEVWPQAAKEPIEEVMAFSNHSSSPDWVSQVTIKSIPTNDQLYQEFKFLDFPRPRSPDSLRLASESSSLGDRLQHHAKVYVLADRYGVERLMELSIHQLHSELLTSTSVEVMSILE
jgi:hypothetical protein